MIEFKPIDKYADVFTERYECDDYACMAHPNGCFFCEQGEDDMTPKGMLGQCQHFKREGKQS